MVKELVTSIERKKRADYTNEHFFCNYRNGEIRTRDLSHPKRTRYQTALRPVNWFIKSKNN